MGLDISHDCWHGAHSAFMRWRCEVAKAAGMPSLLMMEGFYNHTEITRDDASFPIKWEFLKPSPLHILLSHSDCDGKIEPDDCAQIAQELEELLPKLPDGDGGGHIGNWREKTQAFIDGLRLAAHRGEPVEFL